ncbi:MAG: AbrB/MazE/SpoVT family DNA-binding domain-containing protein [Candidatus Freyarchaeum deiterrae]
MKGTRNYQITIPESVRKELEIKEGDYMSIEVSGGGEAVLKKIIPLEDLTGAWDEEMDNIMKDVDGLWKNGNYKCGMRRHRHNSRLPQRQRTRKVGL